MKTIAIFAGSKDLPKSQQSHIESFLDEFCRSVSGNVGKIIYGGGVYGVMGKVFRKCSEYGIDIQGYSLLKYKKKDSEVGNVFFENDDERIKGFYRDGDLFLALPGGLGTIREILQVNDLIKRNECGKQIYIPTVFNAFYNLMLNLGEAEMLADEDMGNFIKMDSINQLSILKD